MNNENDRHPVPNANGGHEPVDRLLHVADLHFCRIVWNPLALLNKRFLGNLNVAIRRRHEFPMEHAEPHVNALCDTGVATALLTGDFTSTATEAEFAHACRFVDALSARGLTLHVLPGNHDVYTFEAHRKQRFERFFSAYLPLGGYPAHNVLPGGTPLVLVPTVCPNWLSSQGRVSNESMEAVVQYLAECAAADRSRCVLVAGHYPVMNHTYGYSVSSGRRLIGAERLRQAMGTAGIPILYVSGHVHRFSYVRDPDFPALHHLSTGAFFRINHREGIEGEFSEIHVKSTGFDVFRHTFKDEWRREAIRLQDT